MTAPQVVDPWQADLTRTQQTNHLHEAVRRITHGETTAPPPTWAELDVDADTRIVTGRLSRWAARRMYRPQREGPFDEHGVDRNGRYNPSADGGGW